MVVVSSFAMEQIQNHYFGDEIKRIGDSMDDTFFLLCGDICLFFGMLCGVSCILSGLYTSSSTPALCQEALQLLFSIHGSWRHCETVSQNDFVTRSLCVKSHVKYSVFWMELCFSSKLRLKVTVWFGWNLNGTFTVRERFWKMKNPREKKITKLLAM